MSRQKYSASPGLLIQIIPQHVPQVMRIKDPINYNVTTRCDQN